MAKAAPETKDVLVDAFAGVGGNTIAFAKTRRWRQIYAIEKDPKALACAKHNAEVYGIDNPSICWIQGDVFQDLSKCLDAPQDNVVIFASPPWGGMGSEESPLLASDTDFDRSRLQDGTGF